MRAFFLNLLWDRLSICSIANLFNTRRLQSLFGLLSIKESVNYQHRIVCLLPHRLVAVHTHGDFIVLPHRETKPSAPWPAIPLSPIILTLRKPVIALS